MNDPVHSSVARAGFKKAEKIANQIKSELDGLPVVPGEKVSYIRDILDKELSQEDEYIGLINQDGVGVVHTNRLREGVVYTDPTSQKSLKATEPLIQSYSRDTGETVIDITIPVVQGEDNQKLNLRLGRKIHRPYLGIVFSSIVLLPIVVMLITGLFLSIPMSHLLLLSLVGGVVGGLLGVYHYASVRKTLRFWRSTTRSVYSGDLTTNINVTKQNEFHQFGTEINKITIGVKSIIHELKKTSELIHSLSLQQSNQTDDILQTSQKLSSTLQTFREGSEQQLSSLQNANGMVQELFSGMTTIREELRQSAHDSEQTAEIAKNERESMNELEKQMNNIERAIDATAEEISEISASIDSITEKISAITAIAKQTNLLALNASIEASRAGEHGNGFAVVAEEIRQLAGHTNTFANDIVTTLEETREYVHASVERIQQNTSFIHQGVDLVTKSRKSIETLEQVSLQAADKVKTNEAYGKQLVKDGEDLTHLINEVNEISEQFMEHVMNVNDESLAQVESIHTLSQSANKLSQMAVDLKTIVQRFKVEEIFPHFTFSSI